MSSRGDKLLPPHPSPPPASPHHIPPTRHPKMTPDPFMCLYQAAKVRNSDESLWLRVYTSESRKEGNQPRSAKSGEVRENSCSPPGLQWFSSRRENLFHVIPAAAENRRPAGNSHCVRVPRSRQLGDSERWMSAEQTAGFIQRRCWNEMLAGEFVACNFLKSGSTMKTDMDCTFLRLRETKWLQLDDCTCFSRQLLSSLIIDKSKMIIIGTLNRNYIFL